MDEKNLNEIQSRIENEYIKRTLKSIKLYEQAKKYLPGGDTRTATFFTPHPLYISKGEGAYLTDVDGNIYLDLINNFSALIHGHSYPPITEAVANKVAQGTVWAGNNEGQIRLAETLCKRIKSVDKVRFVNSGSEATSSAVWAARAFNGKNKIIKMEGGYHGSADMFRISVYATPSKAGPEDEPIGVSELGVSDGTASEVIIVPFNNIEATKNIIEKIKDDISAVIIEPQLGSGGQVPATKEYLHFLREITQKMDILLILDEVQSLRLSYGGAQEIYDVVPDITAMGKMIGGGFAVGAFGGRDDIMNMFSPLAVKHSSHSGTFNGNPVTMVAGNIAMNYFDHAAVTHVNKLADSLRAGVCGVFDEMQLKAQITGNGSLLQLHFWPERVCDFRTSGNGHNQPGTPNARIMHLLHLAMMNRGIFIARRGMLALSTVMTSGEIDNVVSAFRASLQEIYPYIEGVMPELLKK